MDKNENRETTSHAYSYKGREAKNYSKLMMFILEVGRCILRPYHASLLVPKTD